ncbi:glycosyl transferase family 1 [candidate division MSBL1 archaeon SCGC-AAA385D11]|uniref:Glycosyl transferase family 1 n=1 Tax=candidate division MSBL1 archaeon SCGC-AAA385D11 TaxID=1698286 RepID=A0A133VNP4_9EURY|nr:glycosyl transferase family 1 [candidate division MSBL1 archaeon SCGC-AAA385D11]
MRKRLMPKTLADYRDIVGEDEISKIYRKSSEVLGKHILNINATYYGGGVAEILRNMVPLMNDAGVQVGWRAIPANPDFFRVSKKFHNALQGGDINLTEMKKEVYEGTIEEFARFTHINHDLVVVHDPQPLPLILYYKKRQPWIWRCHIDLSSPNEELWTYLKYFGIRYDNAVYHLDRFAWRGVGNYSIMKPSIDPLSIKNTDIPQSTIEKYLRKVGIKEGDSRPLISQISRFDRWKDPMGVLKVFDLIKNEMDCQLLLVGAIAADDPEGQEVYDEVFSEVQKREDVKIAVNVHDIVVNAVQRASDVVLQKSLREGFGLTISEALWKETPVVGSNLGGIPEQIIDGETGYLVDPYDYEDTAEKVMNIIGDENLSDEIGRKGKQHVKENFLIIRHIKEWLDLWTEFLT